MNITTNIKFKDKNKLSMTKLVIFNSISNICFISIIGFSLLINTYGNMSWLVLIGCILISLLLSMFFKGFPNHFNVLKQVKKNHLLRIIILLYLTITITLVTITSTLAIKKYFYTENSTMFIAIFSIFIALLISYNRIKNIFDISMIFFILIPIFYFITLFTLEDRYIRYFLPMNFDLNNLNLALMILIFPLENCLMFLYNNQTKNGVKRKHFLISNFFTLFMLLLIIIDSLSLLSANFLKDIRYPSFYRWHLFSGNKFFQNFDIFLLIIIIITVIFRLSYYLQIFRLTLFAPKKKSTLLLSLLLFSITTYTIYVNVNNIFNIVNKLLYFMFFLILIIFTIFVFKSMEVNNE